MIIQIWNKAFRSAMLCPTRGLLAVCSSAEGFVKPSLGFCSSISSLHTDNLLLFRKS